MFTLTDDACLIVKAIADQTDGGRAVGGIRVSDGAHAGGDYAIEPVGGPEDGDVVIVQNGARVFLAADVADELEETALEAEIDPRGVVSFAFGSLEQTRPEGMTAVRGTGASVKTHDHDHDHDHDHHH